MRKALFLSPMVAMLSVLVGGTPAFAVGEGFASAQASITDTLTNYALPLVIAVLLVGLGIGLLVKYVRKGVRAA